MSAEASNTPPHVLIVEHDPLVAVSIAGILQEAGYAVVGPFRTSDAALQALDTGRTDIAVLDAVLAEQSALPIAAELALRGIPILFMTGAFKTKLPANYGERPLIQKPFAADDLLSMLEGTLLNAAESLR